MTNAQSLWPTLSSGDAKALAGSKWNLNGWTYQFESMHGGGEGFVYELSDKNGKIVAYLRFLDAHRDKPARVNRTEWLMGQQALLDSTLFWGMPRAWVSTYSYGRPDGCNQDFTATFHDAVPGESWRAIKNSFYDDPEGKSKFPTMKVRVKIAKHLIATLAAFERLGFVHGDLSDGNMILNRSSGAMRLIDFDTFLYQGSSTLMFPRLTLAQGSMRGTPGYCPPDIEDTTEPEAFAYSDRHARDMLLMELFGFKEGFPAYEPPRYWHDEDEALRSVGTVAVKLGLDYLSQKSVFDLPENERPSSVDLATKLKLPIADILNTSRGAVKTLSDPPVPIPTGPNSPAPRLLPRQQRLKLSHQSGGASRPKSHHRKNSQWLEWKAFDVTFDVLLAFLFGFLPYFVTFFVILILPTLFVTHWLITGFFLAYLPRETVYQSVYHGSLQNVIWIAAVFVHFTWSAKTAAKGMQEMPTIRFRLLSDIKQAISIVVPTTIVFLASGIAFSIVGMASKKAWLLLTNASSPPMPNNASEALGWPLCIVMLLAAFAFATTCVFKQWHQIALRHLRSPVQPAVVRSPNRRR